MKVGVLGGLGPKATADFMDLVIDNTDVTCDQEHVDMIVSNHATIPDRTAYILDNTKDNPIINAFNTKVLLSNNLFLLV